MLHGDATSETFLSELVTRAGLREPAHDDGVDVRVRLARRRLAHPARVRARGLPLTVFGVGMALRALPRAARRLHGAAATRSPATACAGSTTRTCRRRPSASTSRRGHPAHPRAHRRRSGRSAGTPAATARTPAASSSSTAATSTTATTTATTCRSGPQVDDGDGTQAAAPGRALLARRQRHALRPGAGLQHRRPLLHLPARQLRRALRRGRPGRPRPAEDDVDRHALAACSASPAGSARCSASSTTSAGTTQVWVARRIDIARHWQVGPPLRSRGRAGPGVA